MDYQETSLDSSSPHPAFELDALARILKKGEGLSSTCIEYDSWTQHSPPNSKYSSEKHHTLHIKEETMNPLRNKTGLLTLAVALLGLTQSQARLRRSTRPRT